MLFDQRVFYSDNGVLTDHSVVANDFRAGFVAIPYVSTQDYIYIGTDLPFNHRYIDVQTANTSAAEVVIEIWNGRVFNPAIDIIDQTRVGALPLAKDGSIRWSRNRDTVWVRELDSVNVLGLADTKISNFFWLRLSWSASLFAGTTIKFIGQKFSEDVELFSYYPDLNNASLMSAFATAKTDWNEQHYVAAEQIIRALKRKNVIFSGDQILDAELFVEPSVHKVAELIYAGLGQAYNDRRMSAALKYEQSLDLGFLRIDLDGDSNLTAKERGTATGYLSR